MRPGVFHIGFKYGTCVSENFLPWKFGMLARRRCLLALLLFTHSVHSLFIASTSSSRMALIAQKELQRYLYLTTTDGDLPSLGLPTLPSSGILLSNSDEWRDDVLSPAHVMLSNDTLALIHARISRLRPDTDDHCLLTVPTQQGFNLTLAVGATDRAMLFAIFTLIERTTPIAFRIHGDVLPDRSGLFHRSLAEWTEHFHHRSLDLLMTPGEVAHRGLQPFHDFSEGPDQWSAGEYKHIISQMTKLKLNTIGLHNYGGALTQPSVWLGEVSTLDPDDAFKILPNGTYSASYTDTANGGVWGGTAMNISEYTFGGQWLFASDCFSNHPMHEAGLCPDALLPSSTSNSTVGLWEGTARMLADAFDWAREVNMSTVVGVECGPGAPPSVVPGQSNLTALYSGALERLRRTIKASHFWIWTPESWLARKNGTMPLNHPAIQNCMEHFDALHVARDAGHFNVELATCGWTVGPMTDRTYFDTTLPDDYTLTSINEAVGNFNVETAYGNFSPGRGQFPGLRTTRQ